MVFEANFPQIRIIGYEYRERCRSTDTRARGKARVKDIDVERTRLCNNKSAAARCIFGASLSQSKPDRDEYFNADVCSYLIISCIEQKAVLYSD